MIAQAEAPARTPRPEDLHARFLAFLPRIQQHARIVFRDVRCPQRRDDCVQEVVALAWAWYLRLAGRGRDAGDFVGALATFAARAVRSGRQLCGQQPARDVLSPRAQGRHAFAVRGLVCGDTLAGTPAEDALRDNTRSEVPAQVAFRIDFPAWRATLSERDRRLADSLMVGERAGEVARRLGLSPGRVSQIRFEISKSWKAFCQE